MNWRKIAFITIVTLYGFGLSTVFGYTPLNPEQIKEIRTTLETQLKQNKITTDELRTLNQDLEKIKNKVISYQGKKDSNFMDVAEIYAFVLGLGIERMPILVKFHLPDYLKQWPDNLKDEKIVGDIEKIEAEVNDVLSKSPANTNDL